MNRSRNLAIRVITSAVCFALAATPARAGFLDDFWTANGAAINTTPAGVYQSATGTVFTPGGVVWRDQVRTFTPYSVTAPKLSAGCGGVDFFLGSFSLANKAEFVNFLRAVGQNLAGLAFKVALNALSPSLSAELQAMADTINSWTKDLRNSCKAADAILRTSGADKFIQGTVQSAKSWLWSSGAASDAGESSNRAESDPTTLSSTPATMNSGGKKAGDANVNLVWDAFNQAAWTGFTDQEKMMVMGMLGTTVIRMRSGPNPSDAPIDPPAVNHYVRSELTIDKLVGTIDTTGAAVNDSYPLLSCGTDPDCLSPTLTTVAQETLASRVFRVAKGIQQAVVTRQNLLTLSNPPFADIQAVAAGVNVPILKVAQLSAHPRMSDLGGQYMQVLAYVAAYDMAANYIQSVLTVVEKQLNSQLDMPRNEAYRGAAARITKRARELMADAQKKKEESAQKLSALQSTVEQVTAAERSLYTNVALNFAQNLSFR